MMRSLTPEQRLDRLAELFQQHDKTGWEIAEHCWHLVKVDGLERTQVAVSVGRSPSTIKRYVNTWEFRESATAGGREEWSFGDWQKAAEHGESVSLVAEELEVTPTRAYIDHRDAVRQAKRQLADGISEDKVREAARSASQRSSMTDTEKAVDSRQRAEVHEATSGVRRQVANVHTVGLVSDFQALARAVSVAVDNDADIGLSEFQQIRKAYNSIGEDLMVYVARRSLDADFNVEVLR